MTREDEFKKQIRNFKRKLYRDSKRELTFRYKKYMYYCHVLASSENEEIRRVCEFFEKDAPAYMAPAVLSFSHCKLTPHTLKDKSFDDMWLPEFIGVTGDSMNASLLHSFRILLDRTSLYMHAAYNGCEIGDGIGCVDEKNKRGVMKFVDKQLNSGAVMTEHERLFFKYLKNEYDEWANNLVQVDNKTRHNLSVYDLYEIDNFNEFTHFPSAKGYYQDKKLKKERFIPIDFEAKYISKVYELFDKTLEFTTSIIMSKESINQGTV